MMRRLSSVAVALAAAVTAAPALAQDAPAIAEALFRDGRALLAAGETHAACAKLAESQRLAPKLGTLLNLATCHEVEGKTASAWAELTQASTLAARAGQTERVEFARTHLASVEARLSRVIVRAPHGQSISVELDGIRLDAVVLGTPFPLDPGDHTLTARAPGKAVYSTSLRVPEGPTTIEIAIPRLSTETQTRGEAAPDHAEAPETRHDPVPGILTLGVGAAALTTGAVFGMHSFLREADGDHECEGAACSPRGLELHDDAEAAANLSTAFTAAGLVAVAVGVVLLWHPFGGEPTPRKTAARFAIAPSGRGLSTRW